MRYKETIIFILFMLLSCGNVHAFGWDTWNNKGGGGASLAAVAEVYQPFCGFENRDNSTIDVDENGVFTLDVDSGSTAYVVWTDNIKHTLTASQTKTVTEEGETYLYIDANGDLQHQHTIWNLLDTSIAPCAVVFKQGESWFITDERHGYQRNVAWHKSQHLTVGALYNSGLGGTFADETMSILTGSIYDEDLLYTIGTTQTTALSWYRTSGGSMQQNGGITAAKMLTPGGLLAYDNAGTLTAIDNNKYGVFWVYATNNADYPIFVVCGQANYSNANDARNATKPIIGLSTAEWKLIYKTIYQRTSGESDGDYKEFADYRGVSTGLPSVGVTPGDHNALINRDDPDSHPYEAITGLTDGTADLVVDTVSAADSLSWGSKWGTAVGLDLPVGFDVPAAGLGSLFLWRANTATVDTTAGLYSRSGNVITDIATGLEAGNVTMDAYAPTYTDTGETAATFYSDYFTPIAVLPDPAVPGFATVGGLQYWQPFYNNTTSGGYLSLKTTQTLTTANSNSVSTWAQISGVPIQGGAAVVRGIGASNTTWKIYLMSRFTTSATYMTVRVTLDTGTDRTAYIPLDGNSGTVATTIASFLTPRLCEIYVSGRYAYLYIDGVNVLGTYNSGDIVSGKFDMGSGVTFAAWDVGGTAYPVLSTAINSAALNYTASSLTRVGSTATFNASGLSGVLITGMVATITGANQAEYNITAPITVLSDTQFTYEITGTPATPATTADVITASFPAGTVYQPPWQYKSFMIVDEGPY